MSYTVKEIFYTLQGEGMNVGRPAVFCRFTGCNLQCDFCDTDFVGGDRFESADGSATAICKLWPSTRPFVVLTGGEPALQVDYELLAALHHRRCQIAIETNGTRKLPFGIDWICVSPKVGAPIVVLEGDELKLPWPQAGVDPSNYEQMGFRYRWLQPIDGPEREANTQSAVEYCLRYPRWRLSLQTHKFLGLR